MVVMVSSWVNMELLKQLPDEFSVLLPFNRDEQIVGMARENVFSIRTGLEVLGVFFMRDELAEIEFKHTGRVYGVDAGYRNIGEASSIEEVVNLVEEALKQSNMLTLRMEDYYTRPYVNIIEKRIAQHVFRTSGQTNKELLAREVMEVMGELEMTSPERRTIDGYLPYRVRKRVSKSGRHANISGSFINDPDIKVDYIIVDIRSWRETRKKPLDEVNTIGGELLGYEEGDTKWHIYVLAKPGIRIQVDLWFNNYLESYEVTTGPDEVDIRRLE